MHLDDLPDELLFQILLYCEELKNVSHMLLLNMRCLSMANYEALWRMRLAFFLKRQVWEEELKLARHDQRQLKVSQQKGSIRKLNMKIKSHIEEAEKMYLREKHLCEVGAVLREEEEELIGAMQLTQINARVNNPSSSSSCLSLDDDMTKHSEHTMKQQQSNQKLTTPANRINEKTGGVVDFYIGYRFYTIVKNEVIGRATSRLQQEFIDLFSGSLCNYGLSHKNPFPTVMKPDTNALIIKWNKIVTFVENNFTADSNDLRDMEYHVQRKASPFIINSFFHDYQQIMKHVDKYFKKGLKPPNERVIEFKELNSKMVQPLIDLTSTTKFKYPVNIFKLLEEGAFELSDSTLNESLLRELKLEIQREEKEKRFKNVTMLNVEDIINFLLPQFTPLLNLSYDLGEISRTLGCWIEIFPSLIPYVQSKNVTPSTQSNTSSKTNTDLLASYLISRCPSRDQFISNMSYELLIKATTDWGLYDNFCLSDAISRIFQQYRKIHESKGPKSFRPRPISDEELIEFIRLLENIYNNGENAVDANTVVTCLVFCSSWMLWKFCLEERKINPIEATSFIEVDYRFYGPRSILHRFVEQQNGSMDEEEYLSRIEYIMNYIDLSFDSRRHVSDPIIVILYRFIAFYSQQMHSDDGSEQYKTQFREALDNNTKVQRWKKLVQRMFQMGSRATRDSKTDEINHYGRQLYDTVPTEILHEYPLLLYPFEKLIMQKAIQEECQEIESGMTLYQQLITQLQDPQQ
nr:unnamed protein product [Naegleria fowleri]